MPPSVSLIIPLWKDTKPLIALLDPLPIETLSSLQVIVAAVRPDETLRHYCNSRKIFLVACEKPSRGAQLNQGATVATGALLCFHHADTILSREHLQSLLATSENAEIQGGAFHRLLDQRHPWAFRFQKQVEFLSRWHPLLGDQSIFVTRSVFDKLNGFRDYPLMEDVDFSRRLRKATKIHFLHPPVHSSARRSEQLGSWKTSLLNIAFLSMFYLGVSPHRLHRWYYRTK